MYVKSKNNINLMFVIATKKLFRKKILITEKNEFHKISFLRIFSVL